MSLSFKWEFSFKYDLFFIKTYLWHKVPKSTWNMGVHGRNAVFNGFSIYEVTVVICTFFGTLAVGVDHQRYRLHTSPYVFNIIDSAVHLSKESQRYNKILTQIMIWRVRKAFVIYFFSIICLIPFHASLSSTTLCIQVNICADYWWFFLQMAEQWLAFDFVGYEFISY